MPFAVKDTPSAKEDELHPRWVASGKFKKVSGKWECVCSALNIKYDIVMNDLDKQYCKRDLLTNKPIVFYSILLIQFLFSKLNYYF